MAQTLGVALSGSTTLGVGQSAVYTINVSAGPASTVIGFNAAASTGGVDVDVLSATGVNTQKPVGTDQLTHTLTKNSTNASGIGSYTFTFTVPGTAVAGDTYTLYATARSGGEWNHDGDDLVVTVTRISQAALTARINGSSAPAASNVGLTGALTTIGGSGAGAVTYASQTLSVCTVSSTTVTYIAVGTCTVRATKAQDTQYNSTFDDVSITVNQGSQATLTAQINGSGTPSASTVFLTGALSTTGGSGAGAVTYTSQTLSVCTVSSTTVSYIASGTCTVRATKAADTNYLSTFDDVSQTINLATQSALTALIGGSAAPSASTVFLTGSLTTSGGSGVGAVSYSSLTGTVCSAVGSTVSYIAGGTCTVRATKAADTQYASTFDDVTITVNLATQAALTAQINGSGTPPASTVDLTGALSATGGSGVGAVSYSSLTPTICTVASTTVTYIAINTCTVQATKAADTQYASTSDTVSLTINQASQTISFAPLTDKITTDMPFTVSATGGNSGNPVTFTASGVCTHGGANGSTITLTATVGVCTVTASQAGNANYTAASSVMQSFNVSDPSAEVFPPNCQMPAGWATVAGASFGFSVATDFASTGACSFKSDALTPVTAGGTQFAWTGYTGIFQAGNISFKRKVSSFPNDNCLMMSIDGAYQSMSGACTVAGGGYPGASGEVPFGDVIVPIASGSHTVRFLYYRTNGSNTSGLEAGWIDELTMPLLTSITSPLTATGTYNALFSYQVVADNFPQTYVSTVLPPGLTLNASTGLISGTPTAAGNYPVTITVSNPGGVAPSATDAKIVTLTINKADQVITFNPLNNKLNSAAPFTVSAFGGGSGQPVTFTASGVCTSSGTNGATITVSLTLGDCVVTANQAGDANYNAASAVSQTFKVVGSAFETFPPACNMPAGWVVPVGATTGWSASVNESSTEGACSVKSNPMASAGNPLQADIEVTATVGTGNITFKYRVSSENNWDCFQFFIDGVAQGIGGTCNNVSLTGASGDSGWVSVSIPVTAGTHTFKWRYDKDDICCVGGQDAAWIDEVVFPDETLTVSKAGSGFGTLTSLPAAINCGAICSASLSGRVQVVPTPNTGSYFAGWSGNCTGTGACFVDMTASRSVTATFNDIVAPSIPQSVSATPGNGSATITFSPPMSDGGVPVISYSVTCTAAGNPPGANNGAMSPITVIGLNNGVTYSCAVTAFNGDSTSPAATTSVTPRTVPGAPTGLVGTPGDTTISIAFTPPMNNGGAAITSYEASCSDGMVSTLGTSMGSPVNVSGLANGASYTCAVRASNAAGFGAFSTSINVTPRTVPGAPTSLMATAGDTQVTVAFGAPASNGGAAISSYTVTCTAAGQTTRTATGAMSPLTVTTMTNGIQYSCSATAANIAGTGAASTPVLVTPRTIPGAPTGLVATAGDGQANISFSAPASNGGSTITSYTATCTASGNPDRSGTSAMSPITVMGMTNALAYSCTVTATNAAGTGPASTSVNVTPRTVPDAPVIGAVTPGNGQATVAFTAPMFNGGSPITSYLAFCRIPASSPPYLQTSGAMSPLVVTGMTNGTLYECAVNAQNAAGFSDVSAFVNVTPRTLPGTPTNAVASPRDARAVFNFDPPASDGGSSITGYTVSCNGGAQTASGSGAPITVTGLTNGMVNNCQIIATNVAGSSTTPASVSVTPGVQVGASYWTQICTNCHAMTPVLPQLNAAGTTASVLNYAIANQPLMSAFGEVTALTQNERIAIAQYLATVRPASTATTAFNTPVVVNLAAQLTLGTVSFESMEVVSSPAPASGTLSVLSGTQITFTPTAGFVGMATFTVRGARAMPTALQGDPITVTVTVNPPPVPVINSSLMASGTNGAAFSYQITATNSPTSYAATGLPGGLAVNTMTGLISGTPTVGGSFMVSISATNQGGTGMAATLVITLNPAAQSISFGAQTTSSRAYAPSGTFSISPIATASSGLTVTYSSASPSICTVAGTTVTIVAAGSCVIAANQSGNVNFAAAPQVTQTVTITATLPGAPVIGAATPGNNQATIAFSAPSNTGGVAITGYTATCTPSGLGTGMVSPITITGLSNGTTYTCSVTATNGVGTSSASGTVMVTPAPTPTAPTVTSANNATFTVGQPGSFNVTATGTPSVFTFSATGTLPMGVTLNTMTGNLGGTPTQAGTFPVTLGVTNGVMPNASQGFTLTVNAANQTISFSGPAAQSLSVGSLSVAASATSGLTVTFASTTPSTCTVSGTTVTLVAVGTCTVRASQAGNANFNAASNVDQSFTISQGTQTITFGAQTSPRAYANGGTFAINPVATSSSMLAVTHSSLTTAVCTVSGTIVTMVRAGTCTLAANQAGNSNYAAAAQVTQSVTITGTNPGAPTLNTATGGDTKITLAFTAPANDGGSSITSYTATCGGITAMGVSSPIAVTGLTNGMSYSCGITATNSTGTSGASNTIMATPNALPGATVWANSCALGGCHGPAPATPTGFRLNAGGSSSTVLDYALAHPSGLMGAMVTLVNATTNAQQRADVAAYINEFVPAVIATTPFNTPVDISVATQIILNTPSVALTGLQQASAPSNGTLSFPGGTTITYTPNNGFVGTDTFTYRGFQAGVQTDVRTVTVTVTPAAPVITSSLTANGTVGAAFNYQIAATNAPTSYGAPSLPAGLSVNTMTGAITGMPSATGSASYTISATNAGGTGSAMLTITISGTPQVITFPAQAPASRAFNISPSNTFAISPTATGGASGNPIVYSSTTTGVCTVSGSTVTMVSSGVCTIAANQAGNATFAAAAQVTQSVTITSTAPGAPTIGSGTAGNTQATINFAAPANTGGLPITLYTASCNGITNTGMASPITVSGLTNGVGYTCSVQATNGAGTSVASGTVMVTPVAIAFTGTVYSRKQHGTYTGNLDINETAMFNAATIEPRGIGSGHQIVFVFNNPVTSANVAVTDAMDVPIAGAAAAPSFLNNELIVTVTGVADATRVKVKATSVNGALNVETPIAFLYGDVNQTGKVTAADIAAIKAKSGTTQVDGTNYLRDINVNGGVNATDVSAAKAKAGNILP